MQAISKALERVGRVADQVGVEVLAEEAGLPPSTVRSYNARGWKLKPLSNCEKLIAAAQRLEASPKRVEAARRRVAGRREALRLAAAERLKANGFMVQAPPAERCRRARDRG